MTTALPAAEVAAPEVDAAISDVLAAEVEAWLTDPARTAHRLVSLPTAQLVMLALAGQPAPAAAPAMLPGGLWRILPDRLLALRPRRGDTLEQLRITPAQHLALTALVLEQWGWAQSGLRIRTRRGRRCILGAQRVVHALGYGTEHTATEAGRLLNGTLTARGITMPYPAWNELPSTTEAMALGLVRDTARETPCLR